MPACLMEVFCPGTTAGVGGESVACPFQNIGGLTFQLEEARLHTPHGNPVPFHGRDGKGVGFGLQIPIIVKQ